MLGLAVKALVRGRIDLRVGTKDLQGHRAAELLVDGAIDLADAAAVLMSTKEVLLRCNNTT